MTWTAPVWTSVKAGVILPISQRLPFRHRWPRTATYSRWQLTIGRWFKFTCPGLVSWILFLDVLLGSYWGSHGQGAGKRRPRPEKAAWCCCPGITAGREVSCSPSYIWLWNSSHVLSRQRKQDQSKQHIKRLGLISRTVNFYFSLVLFDGVPDGNSLPWGFSWRQNLLLF